VQLAPSLANGTVIPLTLDPAVSTLSNQVATAFENRYNRKLTLISGSIVIGGTSTTTTLGSNPNPSTTGTPVTFTATISSATAGGTMTFYDGSNAIGFATVSSGQASFTTSALSAGTHSITAAYEGDATYLPSTSSSVSQSVQHVLNAPAGLAAQATSTTSATLSWPAVQDATSYEIRRRSSSTNGAYVVVGATSNTNFTDNNLAPDSAYLYVVYAINGGGYSPASTPDPVTTIAFSDDPLVAGTTLVKAAHLNELRAAVNALRAIQALPPAVFTDGSLAGQPIRAMHLQELRSAVSTVRSILGVPAPAFTDPTITTQSTAIRAVHVQDLRSAVR